MICTPNTGKTVLGVHIIVYRCRAFFAGALFEIRCEVEEQTLTEGRNVCIICFIEQADKSHLCIYSRYFCDTIRRRRGSAGGKGEDENVFIS